MTVVQCTEHSTVRTAAGPFPHQLHTVAAGGEYGEIFTKFIG